MYVILQKLALKTKHQGRPHGRVVKLARSASAAQGFPGWILGVDMAPLIKPQLEGPTTKNIQLCTGGLGGEKGKIVLKKSVKVIKIQED